MTFLDLMWQKKEHSERPFRFLNIQVGLQEGLNAHFIALQNDRMPTPEVIRLAWMCVRDELEQVILELRSNYLGTEGSSENPWDDVIDPCLTWWSEERFDFSCCFEWQHHGDPNRLTFGIWGDGVNGPSFDD
jgi:hypothetical protein